MKEEQVGDTPINEIKVKCVFCNAEWSPDMKLIFDVESLGSCSCGGWARSTGEIEIKCENCDRIVYRKEFVGDEELI